MSNYEAMTGAEIAAMVPPGGTEFAETPISYAGAPLYAMRRMPTTGKQSGAARSVKASLRNLGRPVEGPVDAIGIRKAANEIMAFADVGGGRFVSATKTSALGPGLAAPAAVFCLCLSINKDWTEPAGFSPDEILSAMDIAETIGDAPGRKIFLRCRSEYYLKGLGALASGAMGAAEFRDYCDMIDARQSRVDQLARAIAPDVEARDIMPEAELGIVRDSKTWNEAVRKLEQGDKRWKMIFMRSAPVSCDAFIDIADAKAYTDIALSPQGADMRVVLKPSCRRYYEMFLSQTRGMELFGVRPAAGSTQGLFPLAGTFAVDGGRAEKLYWTSFEDGGADFIRASMRAYSPAVVARFKEFVK
ncbi:MAG: hypothetical protein LBL46_01860 [Rickettsiales bacterium]|nr:hypothetical protein [Rickettsiales bacterium]